MVAITEVNESLKKVKLATVKTTTKKMQPEKLSVNSRSHLSWSRPYTHTWKKHQKKKHEHDWGAHVFFWGGGGGKGLVVCLQFYVPLGKLLQFSCLLHSPFL